MADGQRTTRFAARIALERRFLTPVNKVFGDKAPLAGMTSDAIGSWQERAGEHYEQTQVTAIAAILTETARRSMIRVDDSREVFDPALRKPSGIDELLSLLEHRLAEVHGR